MPNEAVLQILGKRCRTQSSAVPRKAALESELFAKRPGESPR